MAEIVLIAGAIYSENTSQSKNKENMIRMKFMIGSTAEPRKHIHVVSNFYK